MIWRLVLALVPTSALLRACAGRRGVYFDELASNQTLTCEWDGPFLVARYRTKR